MAIWEVKNFRKMFHELGFGGISVNDPCVPAIPSHVRKWPLLGFAPDYFTGFRIAAGEVQ
jgi:hypothetical protein